MVRDSLHENQSWTDISDPPMQLHSVRDELTTKLICNFDVCLFHRVFQKGEPTTTFYIDRFMDGCMPFSLTYVAIYRGIFTF